MNDSNVQNKKDRNQKRMRDKYKSKKPSAQLTKLKSEKKAEAEKEKAKVPNNWDRYEEDLDKHEDVQANLTNFNTLSSNITERNFFQFKHEKKWLEEIKQCSTQVPEDNSFHLNLNLMKSAIGMIPLPDRCGIPRDLFTVHNKMDKSTSLEEELISTLSEIRSLEHNNHLCQSVPLNNVQTNTQGRVSVYMFPSNENPPISSQPPPEVILDKLMRVEIELEQCFGSSKTIPQDNKNTAPVSDEHSEKTKDLKSLQSSTVPKTKQKAKSTKFGHTEEETSSKALNSNQRKCNQPQEIFTTKTHSLNPERNTQIVSKENVTNIEVDLEKNSTEDSRTILSYEEKEKLLLYLCYHSFELLDFKDDGLWQNLIKKKEFKTKSWKVYKKQFLDNLVNSIDVYHIPYYFVEHMRQTYGKKSKSSFSCEELGKSKKCTKTTNDPASCQQSRRNIGDLNIFSSDEEKDSRTCKKEDQQYCNNVVSMNKSSNSASKTKQSKNKLNLTTSSHNSSDKTQTEKGKNNIKDNKSSEKENSGNSFDYSNIDDNEMKTLETKYSFLQNFNMTPNHSTCKSNVAQKMRFKETLKKSDLDTSDTDTLLNQINKSQVQLRRKTRSGLKRAKKPVSSDEGSSDTNVKFHREMKNSSPKVKSMFGFLTKANSNYSTPTSITPKKENLSQSHKTPRTPRQLFMNYEKEKMLKYMEKNSSKLNTIKGNKFWQEMEASGVIKGRTWHSLRNHFFKTMIFDLRRFKLKPEFENKLKELVGQKR